MKSKSNEVYELISVLSKMEKRYINTYLSNENLGQLKLKLFKAICLKKPINIIEFEDNLKWVKNIFKLKYDLYNAILKHLENYHNSNEMIKLRRNLIYIEILYSKNLHNQCKKLIDKALKKAKELEAFSLVFELHVWQYKVAVNTKKKKEIEVNYRNQIKALENAKIERSFFKVNSLLFLFENKVHSKKNTEQIDKLILDPIFSLKNSKTSFRSELIYIQGFTFYHSWKKNWEDNYFSTKKMVKLLLSQNKKGEQNKRLLPVFMNHAISCLKVRKDSEFIKYCDLLLSTKGETELEIVRKTELYISILLGGLIEFGEVDAAINLEKKHNTIKNNTYLSPLFNLGTLFNFSNINFLAGNYKKALHYINVLRNRKESLVRSDLKTVIEPLNLLIHYELKNYDLAENLFATYQRKLNNPSIFERWFLNFYSKLLQEVPSSRFFIQEEKLLLYKTKLGHEFTVETLNILIWIRRKHETIKLSKALNNYYSIGFKKYKKYRLTELNIEEKDG